MLTLANGIMPLTNGIYNIPLTNGIMPLNNGSDY